MCQFLPTLSHLTLRNDEWTRSVQKTNSNLNTFLSPFCLCIINVLCCAIYLNRKQGDIKTVLKVLCCLNRNGYQKEFQYITRVEPFSKDVVFRRNKKSVMDSKRSVIIKEEEHGFKFCPANIVDWCIFSLLFPGQWPFSILRIIMFKWKSNENISDWYIWSGGNLTKRNIRDIWFRLTLLFDRFMLFLRRIHLYTLTARLCNWLPLVPSRYSFF